MSASGLLQMSLGAVVCERPSWLGVALLGQKGYAETEPLLLAGSTGMNQREAQIPPVGNPAQATAWQRQLDELSRSVK